MATTEFLIPYVGRPDYVRQAVLSVLAQDDDDWRLVVVEDGPQGHQVAEWVAELRDPRVQHVLNEVNLGVAPNFQRCLELASSPWVVFLGCDDLLLPSFVRSVRASTEAFPGAAAVMPRVDVIDEAGGRGFGLTDRVKRLIAPSVERPTSWAGDAILASMLRGNWTYFPSICWRREVISRFGFRQDLDLTLDLALMAEVLLSGREIVGLPETLFKYRRHAESASSLGALQVDRFREEGRLFREMADRCQALGWTRSARAARWHVTSRLHALALAATPRIGRSARRGLFQHAVAR